MRLITWMRETRDADIVDPVRNVRSHAGPAAASGFKVRGQDMTATDRPPSATSWGRLLNNQHFSCHTWLKEAISSRSVSAKIIAIASNVTGSTKSPNAIAPRRAGGKLRARRYTPWGDDSAGIHKPDGHDQAGRENSGAARRDWAVRPLEGRGTGAKRDPGEQPGLETRIPMR
jgi:hypothetical protein